MNSNFEVERRVLVSWDKGRWWWPLRDFFLEFVIPASLLGLSIMCFLIAAMAVSKF